MTNTFFLAPTANFVQTTLNGAINNSTGTIILNSVTNVTAPGYAIIDRQSSAGTNTPSLREVVSYTGISGNNLTGCTRGADGSSALAHSDGAIVEFSPTVGMFNNLATIVGTSMTSDGYIKAIPSPVTIGRVEATNLIGANASITTLFIKTNIQASGASVVGFPVTIPDPLSVAQFAATSLASIAQLFITSALQVSGASIVGVMPSGASGAVLTSRGNTVVPVFASNIPRLKVGTFTYDLTTASGTQAVTGVGFQPKALAFIGYLTSIGWASWGFDDGTDHYGFDTEADAKYYTMASKSIGIGTTAGNYQYGAATTMGADGFTITWTKVGTPSGTGTVYYLAIG